MNKLQLSFLLMIIVLSGCALNKSGDKENNVCDLCLYQLYIDADGNLREPITTEIIGDESEYIDDIFNNLDWGMFQVASQKDLCRSSLFGLEANTVITDSLSRRFLGGSVIKQGEGFW